MSAFSSPPAPPKRPHPFTYMGTDSLQWVPEALLCGKPLGSPLLSVAKLAEHAAELTPASEQLANASLRALLLPIPLPSLMDKDDAKAYLDQVAEKMVARAAKKRASRVLQRQRSGRTLRSHFPHVFEYACACRACREVLQVFSRVTTASAGLLSRDASGLTPRVEV